MWIVWTVNISSASTLNYTAIVFACKSQVPQLDGWAETFTQEKRGSPNCVEFPKNKPFYPPEVPSLADELLSLYWNYARLSELVRDIWRILCDEFPYHGLRLRPILLTLTFATAASVYTYCHAFMSKYCTSKWYRMVNVHRQLPAEGGFHDGLE
jgi:hypothetical protein